MRTHMLIIAICLGCQVLTAQQSFSLEEAVDFAIQNRNEIKLAHLDVDKADAQLTEYRAVGLPHIDASLKYQYYMEVPVSPVEDFVTPAVIGILSQNFEEIPPFQGPPEVFEFSIFRRNNLTAGVDMRWLLLDGSYFSGLKAAKVFKELTRKAIDVEEEEIRAQVTRAYMNILIAEENREILRNNIANLDKILGETRALYENGFAESLDVERLELSLGNLQTEFQKTDQVIAISYNLLKFQMGFPLDRDIALSEDLQALVDLMSVEEVNLGEEIDYSKKPAYEQILLGQKLNELNLQRFRRGYLPSLSATANISESLQRNDLFDSDELGWIPTSSVGLSLNIPIFDGLLKQGQIQQARIELDKIDVQKHEYERATDLQVSNARLQYQSAKKTLLNSRKNLEIVQRIYDKTMIKFNEGVGSSIEVTQAESQLYDVQGAYINALYDLMISKTELEIALGNI